MEPAQTELQFFIETNSGILKVIHELLDRITEKVGPLMYNMPLEAVSEASTIFSLSSAQISEQLAGVNHELERVENRLRFMHHSLSTL